MTAIYTYELKATYITSPTIYSGNFHGWIHVLVQPGQNIAVQNMTVVSSNQALAAYTFGGYQFGISATVSTGFSGGTIF